MKKYQVMHHKLLDKHLNVFLSQVKVFFFPEAYIKIFKFQFYSFSIHFVRFRHHLFLIA